ncbi:hypothetical protein RUE5091_03592 [Ruegeria denitrificans]|uniref:Uncharacterized protein n=1 Tax=Ruegeria denitrificans TaxID=1715692 RepID=A0A0P1IHG7_9RHOB|nr:hypothetical protein [Ruegeria denitrificans]CUK12938.1 hypothetical protein RUE5091_03592 [Ruegeria denitrificans]
MTEPTNRVLILGSALGALAARDWARDPFTHIVAINNAWRIRPDWDVLIHPEDFPEKNLPTELATHQRIVTAQIYVPVQNSFGGFVYAGGTMAFTAGYWALAALQPTVLAFFGCDMIYPKTGKTHFYGTGQADPLRADITLRSLEAKSARLALFGAAQRCRVARLSKGESRLLFPSVGVNDLANLDLPETGAMKDILLMEDELGYHVPSGRYWEGADRFDPSKIDDLDRRWFQVYCASTAGNST